MADGWNDQQIESAENLRNIFPVAGKMNQVPHPVRSRQILEPLNRRAAAHHHKTDLPPGFMKHACGIEKDGMPLP